MEGVRAVLSFMTVVELGKMSEHAFYWMPSAQRRQ